MDIYHKNIHSAIQNCHILLVLYCFIATSFCIYKDPLIETYQIPHYVIYIFLIIIVSMLRTLGDEIRLAKIYFVIMLFLCSCISFESKNGYLFMVFSIISLCIMTTFRDRKLYRFVLILFGITVVLFIVLKLPIAQALSVLDFVITLVTLIICGFIMLSFVVEIELQEEQNLDQLLSMEDLMKVIKSKRDEAKAATESKSLFLAKMSHEIRTPINAILGMNEMIIRESKEHDIKKYAFDIKSSAKTLLSIINDILDASKIESGKMEIIPSVYETASLINDLYNMLSLKATDKNLSLVFNIDENLPIKLIGDDIRIRQILLNLMNNALKYTETGSVELIIGYKKIGYNAKLTIKVNDTGIGIKEEDIDKLFIEYQRIEEGRNRNIEGTGLGMNIAVQLIKLMGSELKIESTYGKGSSFYFDLEQEIVDETPLGNVQNRIEVKLNEEQYRNTFTAPNAHILIVDDNDVNRKVFCNLLKNKHMNIVEADSGMACLREMEKSNFDIIFLDHMMPEMDGIETMHEIKERYKGLTTPIIMLTANAIIGMKEYYLSLGFDDFLSKPIIPDNLDAMILKYLPANLICEVSDEVVNINASGTMIAEIEDFDMAYAKQYVNDEQILTSILKDYYNSLEQYYNKLNIKLDEITDEGILAKYRIDVHALKSSSASVGALILSKLSLILERAAINKDYHTITNLHNTLLNEIKRHNEILKQHFGDIKNDTIPLNISLLDNLLWAMEHTDIMLADKIVRQLQEQDYNNTIDELMDELYDNVILFDKDLVFMTINKIKETMS